MSAELAVTDQSSRSYRDYSAEFKAEALLTLTANNNNVYKTAKELSIAQSLLRYWVEQETDECRKIREGRKGELAEQFEHLSRVYIDRALEPDAIAKTSGYYAVAAAGDAIKSAQLLRGQPTQIVQTQADFAELLPSVMTIAQEQRLTQPEAALLLASQLSDVPELAALLREWAAGEQERQGQQGLGHGPAAATADADTPK
jgi:transposase-like protein